MAYQHKPEAHRAGQRQQPLVDAARPGRAHPPAADHVDSDQHWSRRSAPSDAASRAARSRPAGAGGADAALDVGDRGSWSWLRSPSLRRSANGSTTTPARVLMTRVKRNSTRPAPEQARERDAAGLGVARRRCARRSCSCRSAAGCVVNVEHRRDDRVDDDRLAERAAEAEHDAADDAAATERHHDRPDHPPAGRARARSRPRAHRSAPARRPPA